MEREREGREGDGEEGEYWCLGEGGRWAVMLLGCGLCNASWDGGVCCALFAFREWSMVGMGICLASWALVLGR